MIFVEVDISEMPLVTFKVHLITALHNLYFMLWYLGLVRHIVLFARLNFEIIGKSIIGKSAHTLLSLAFFLVNLMIFQWFESNIDSGKVWVIAEMIPIVK